MARGLEAHSPIRHLLHTNFVPAEAECDAVRLLLNESLESLRQLDTEILQLQTAMAKLVDIRQKLSADIDAHQAMITPARRMPSDIIQEIFVACLPTDGPSVIDSNDAPILLGQICHSWRHVAHSTAALWTDLHIVIPGTAEQVKDLSEVIKLWLGRSGGLPLSITVVLSQAFKETISVAEIFAALNMFSRRWKNIQFPFSLASQYLHESLALLSAEDVPMLETILMCSHIRHPTQAVRLPILEAPNLSGAHLNFFGHQSILPARWDTLTELHLNTGRPLGFATSDVRPLQDATFLAPQTAVDILRRCPNLVDLCLEVTYDFSEVTMPMLDVRRDFGPPVVLSDLKIFAVSFSGRQSTTLDLFFHTLVLPALESFEFTGYIGKSSPPFLPILTRTTALTHLSLQLRGFMVEPVSESLRHTPDLTNLRLANIESMQWATWLADSDTDPSVPPHEGLLNLLTASDTDLICPRLTSLELDRCTLFSDAGLCEFLKRRLGTDDGTDPLKNFTARFSRQMDTDIEAVLRPFIAQDVTFSLTYPPPPFSIPQKPYSPWEGVFDAIPHFNPVDPWPGSWQYA
ncbi:hypothetical protein B0H16DRAFT_1359059 [Mycena metata]|uniref:F-box domain-containing protein n=1 Tax=Mycena metata TaxID=1033252 RepID=A0AAD7KC34_9AGAR|nr:hypothetical protein B0H16DRAFT_1359059 [Mycena metata]